MRQISRAFTLVELLVVAAILGLLGAILFPVAVSARGAADRATCISNLHALGLGTHLYLSDYDDRLMPVNHDPTQSANSRNDRTWVQNLLPYVTSFSTFRCPADHTNRPLLEDTFDQDLVPGDTDSQYYTASLRSNYGYNFQNLAPIVFENGRWTAEPKSASLIVEPSATLLYVESVWAQTEDGEPTGGGNWLVTPPCRYYAGDVHEDSFTGGMADSTPVFAPIVGWNSEPKANKQEARTGGHAISTYGNAWPWHFGHMNVSMLDGSVHSLTPAELGVGCNVMDSWKGLIYDRSAYLWDVQ